MAPVSIPGLFGVFIVRLSDCPCVENPHEDQRIDQTIQEQYAAKGHRESSDRERAQKNP
jgi:hypothetical protein